LSAVLTRRAERWAGPHDEMPAVTSRTTRRNSVLHQVSISWWRRNRRRLAAPVCVALTTGILIPIPIACAAPKPPLSLTEERPAGSLLPFRSGELFLLA